MYAFQLPLSIKTAVLDYPPDSSQDIGNDITWYLNREDFGYLSVRNAKKPQPRPGHLDRSNLAEGGMGRRGKE